MNKATTLCLSAIIGAVSGALVIMGIISAVNNNCNFLQRDCLTTSTVGATAVGHQVLYNTPNYEFINTMSYYSHDNGGQTDYCGYISYTGSNYTDGNSSLVPLGMTVILYSSGDICAENPFQISNSLFNMQIAILCLLGILLVAILGMVLMCRDSSLSKLTKVSVPLLPPSPPYYTRVISTPSPPSTPSTHSTPSPSAPSIDYY